MLHNRKRPSALVQLTDLFLMELTNWRWSWQTMISLGIATPMLSIIALGTFASNASSTTLTYILIGNVVLALMFENLNKVSSRFAFMRFMGNLDYFATLPIERYLLTLAMVFAFQVLSLPALIITIAFGAWFLDISLTLHPLLVLVVPLCAIPLSGIGAFIGSIARSPEEASSLNLLVTLVLLGIGPVIIPNEQMPDFMIILGSLSPATYAASALRQVLIGPMSWSVLVDMGALVMLSMIIFWLVGRRRQWHGS